VSQRHQAGCSSASERIEANTSFRTGRQHHRFKERPWEWAGVIAAERFIGDGPDRSPIPHSIGWKAGGQSVPTSRSPFENVLTAEGNLLAGLNRRHRTLPNTGHIEVVVLLLDEHEDMFVVAVRAISRALGCSVGDMPDHFLSARPAIIRESDCEPVWDE
jgi:hypothetical protein